LKQLKSENDSEHELLYLNYKTMALTEIEKSIAQQVKEQ
jgi:hypothetical protein